MKLKERIIRILKNIGKTVSNKLHCDRHGSCVHFAEIFVEEVNEQYPELLNDFDVIEGYVNVKFGNGIPQEHTWIRLKNGDIIDPTFLQFNKYDSNADYSKKRTKVYSGQEYYDEGKEGSWFSQRRKEFPSSIFKEGKRKYIRNILREETLKDSLTDLIKTDGIQRASKTVGGFKRLAKILEIDLDDINDQAKLVKDFIYSENVEGVEVLFIEERTGRSGGKIIDVHLKHYFDDNVSYIDSWYKQIMLDKFKKLFPFDVRDVGHPVFFSTKPKISLDCHVIEDEDIEDDTENVTENVTEERNFSNEFKRRVKELDILIRAVLEEIYPCDYRTSGEFIEAIIDDVIWVARTKFDDDVYMMVKKNVPDYILDYKKRELTDIFIQVKEECEKNS